MATPTPEPHTHAKGTCPVVSNAHDWCPKQAGDSRSPCPALNTLANHGYLPRDGKNIGPLDFVRGLREGYNLSRPLSYFLAFGAAFLLGQFGRVSLGDLARHGHIEHDASLAHADTAPEEEYAPTEVDAGLLARVCGEARGGAGGVMDAEDVAVSRVRREGECKPLGGLQAELARGEMGIALGLFGVREGGREGMPVRWFREWVYEERLPTGWKAERTTGILDTVRHTNAIRNAMTKMRKVD